MVGPGSGDAPHLGVPFLGKTEWIEPEILTTPVEIKQRLVEIERACRATVDIMVKGASPSDTAEEPLRRMLERGVRIRCIYERSILDTPTGETYLARWREMGEQQRLIDRVPFRAAVFDRSTVLVPLSSQATSITSLLEVKAGLGEAFAEVFELLWQQRSTYITPRSLTDQEVQILTLMCEGMSDHKIAKKLEIGVRTVQRRLGELTSLFQVASRPALAAKVVALGLITPFLPPVGQHGPDAPPRDM